MLTIFNDLSVFIEDNYCKINVRGYAKIQGISPPHASKILNNFEKEGLLQKEIDRRDHFFYANRENLLFLKVQQAYYQQKFTEFTAYIESKFITPVIYLFGSFAKAEITEKSDIDIAVFSVTKKKIKLGEFEKRFGREIQLFVYKDRAELKKNSELLNNILNGVILAGSW